MPEGFTPGQIAMIREEAWKVLERNIPGIIDRAVEKAVKGSMEAMRNEIPDIVRRGCDTCGTTRKVDAVAVMVDMTERKIEGYENQAKGAGRMGRLLYVAAGFGGGAVIREVLRVISTWVQ